MGMVYPIRGRRSTEVHRHPPRRRLLTMEVERSPQETHEGGAHQNGREPLPGRITPLVSSIFELKQRKP